MACVRKLMLSLCERKLTNMFYNTAPRNMCFGKYVSQYLVHGCKYNAVSSVTSSSWLPVQFRNYSKSSKSLQNTQLTLQDQNVLAFVEHLVADYDVASQVLMQENVTNEEKGKASSRLVYSGQVVSRYKDYKSKAEEISELENMIKESSDGSLVNMAKSDIELIREDMDGLDKEILFLLVPPEYGDDSDIILEVSAGVGGQEAILFTREILNMYMNYAHFRGWSAQILSQDEAEKGGLRYATVLVSGKEVFKRMKYEGGVHRVQRVPDTEKSGRVHTSTVAVAVMPQPTEVDIVIHKKDLRIDTFRAAGAGGQHVNKTDSAVRITHLPTGTVAECQAGRSQIQNREDAMKILRSRLYDKEMQAQAAEYGSNRKLQVGTASRSEKIRTYNFTQDRITDHRIGKNMYKIEDFMTGSEDLDDMIEFLQEESRREKLIEILENFLVSDASKKEE